MKINNRVDLLEVFGSKEKEIIIRVLEKYQFSKIVDITKIRGTYKVETDKGVLCLKKIKHGVKRTKYASDFAEELLKIGFNNTPQYLKTLDKSVFVKYKNMIFYAIEWIDGERLHFNNIIEVQKCIQLLGRFHLASSKIDNNHLRIKNNIKNWPQIFSNNILELEKIKKIIKNKRVKNEFDLGYFKFIDNYISTSTFALKILNDSNFYDLSKLALDNKTICKERFYYENILEKDDESFIGDLNNIVIDLNINNLANIIRKLMYKNEYQWNFTNAKLLLESYNLENKLSKEEMEVMLALIIFPYKFCKLGKKRYINHKSWDEVKYMHKLNRIIKYNELEQQFIENYLNYISTYV